MLFLSYFMICAEILRKDEKYKNHKSQKLNRNDKILKAFT